MDYMFDLAKTKELFNGL